MNKDGQLSAKDLSENDLDKPGIWYRFSGWLVVNVVLRLFKYKE
ncbi:MAG TPA: hypothetical protein PKJ26_03140 [Candidatus Woesebacteria bacterium]|nr:hypothetical protein [Candidatus Woesebacteria bacterium]HNS65465.1 hypothetical protein [Candidatus Woesebacteria bacterium]